MADNNAGFLVTLVPDVTEDDLEAIAGAIGEVKGVVSVRRYAVDPAELGATERNDARWRESIVHLLDDEGV
jgi:hypothetical protein